MSEYWDYILYKYKDIYKSVYRRGQIKDEELIIFLAKYCRYFMNIKTSISLKICLEFALEIYPLAIELGEVEFSKDLEKLSKYNSVKKY